MDLDGMFWGVPNPTAAHLALSQEVAINSVMLRTMTLWGAGMRGLAGRALKVDLVSQDCDSSQRGIILYHPHPLACSGSQLLSRSKSSVGKRKYNRMSFSTTLLWLVISGGSTHTNLTGNCSLQFYSHNQGLEGVCLRIYRRQNPETRKEMIPFTILPLPRNPTS